MEFNDHCVCGNVTLLKTVQLDSDLEAFATPCSDLLREQSDSQFENDSLNICKIAYAEAPELSEPSDEIAKGPHSSLRLGHPTTCFDVAHECASDVATHSYVLRPYSCPE